MAEYDDDEKGGTYFEECKAAARKQHGKLKLHARIKKMAEYKLAKETAEHALKEINAHYDVLRFELVPEQMEEDGVEKLTLEGVGRISLTGDLNIQVLKQNRPDLFAWFKKNKLGDLIQSTVNSSTLKAWVKRRIEDGKPVPELIKVTPITRASITKA